MYRIEDSRINGIEEEENGLKMVEMKEEEKKYIKKGMKEYRNERIEILM